MPKKSKVGKQRKDKYYHLAKETGFRARSAFKLIQLNRKFQFLQNARVLVDLCAAPGGWLQVAQQHMAVSSIIIGVDLVPIKAVTNCITLQHDITADGCRKAIQKELKTWEADCVLNDGAPNVGSNWLQDAFTQAQLTLSALKVATGLLRKGGTFVTKVFRSKDYLQLVAVCGKLFKNVHVTKPQASRNESAEIFIVCLGYRKPADLDPGLLDPKVVFENIDDEKTRQKINLIHPEKDKRKAEGYKDDQLILFSKLQCSVFVTSPDYLDLLAESNEISFDDEKIANHVLTTPEIKLLCADIRLLGRREIRQVLTWRKKLREAHRKELKEAEEASGAVVVSEEKDEEEEKEIAIDQQVAEAVLDEKRSVKRKRQKEMKEHRKYRDRVQMDMIHPGDHHDANEDEELFRLNLIKTDKDLQQVTDDAELPEPEPEVEKLARQNFKIVDTKKADYFDDEDPELPESNDHERDDDVNVDEFSLGSDISSDDDDIDDDIPTRPEPVLPGGLVEDLDYRAAEVKQQAKTDAWFQNSVFDGVEEEEDEDYEIQRMADNFRLESGSKKLIAPKKSLVKKGTKSSTENVVSDDQVPTSSKTPAADKDEVVVPTKRVKLDPETLALGEIMIHSSKTRRQLIEDSWNRYTNNDEDLPDWFADDEKKHFFKRLPVTKEQVEYYKSRMKAVDSRSVKRVVEAKARKRKRELKKMERARKRAENVLENEDLMEKEKQNEVKKIYKAAAQVKKTPVTYVVAKKGVGKRVKRPTGVKGKFKMVDGRMKTDVRGEYKKTAGKGKGKPKSGKGATRGKGPARGKGNQKKR